MVLIAPPPPLVVPEPKTFTLSKNETCLRVYNPGSHNTQALSFRHFGPLRRFDHQRETPGKPAHNPDRGIFYASTSLSGCLVEIFGDTRVIDVGTFEVAQIKCNRDLTLLDLRGDGAMKAGTVSAVCKDTNHSHSQNWSRYFYENPFIYGTIDGLIFGNAHNDEIAFALYERCEQSLVSVMTTSLRHDSLRDEIRLTAVDFKLFVAPY